LALAAELRRRRAGLPEDGCGRRLGRAGLSGAENSTSRLLPLQLSGATAKDIGCLLWMSKECHGGSKKDAMGADAPLVSETNNR
jgi:hypothetical protein